eukprot:COSAG02_NODE_2727_length_8152_cov_58.639017_6_plen_55_part_00
MYQQQWRQVGVRVVAVKPSVREADQEAGQRLKLEEKGVIVELLKDGGAVVRWDV